MTPRPAAIRERMLELEMHGEDYLPIGEFIARLLDVEHTPAFDSAMTAEVNRARHLWRTTYAPMFGGDPRTQPAVAFLQGVTFAVAVRQLIDNDERSEDR